MSVDKLSARTNVLDDFARYARYVNPIVDEIQKSLGIQKEYIRGEGHTLTYLDKDGNEGEVLDMAGGYGSLIFGHNHPEILQTAKDFMDSKRPVHIQISYRPVTALLAEKLAELAKKYVGEDYVIRFANTGAEAVDLAVKHCELKRVMKMQELLDKQEEDIHELKILFDQGRCKIPGNLFRHTEMREMIFEKKMTPDVFIGYLMRLNAPVLASRPVIFALKGAFHGKTIGASQMTFAENFRRAFMFFGMQTFFVDYENIDDMKDLIDEHRKTFYSFKIEEGVLELVEHEFPVFTAAIMEPVQGEGGIREIKSGFVKDLRKLCDDNNIALIFDEIQSGMGRTGTFFASQVYNVVPDIYLIAKSIGGGILKNSCILIKEKIYEKPFGIIHTSTFAEDDLSSTVGLKVLEMLEADNGAAYKKATEIGDKFIQGLQRLKEKYPLVIKNIRGRGLMLGVEFFQDEYADCSVIRNTNLWGQLGYLIYSYFHEIEGIRAMPTASAPSTIRLEPGVILKDEEIARVLAAFERLCEILDKEDGYHFIQHIVNQNRGDRKRDVVNYRTGKCQEEYDEYTKKSIVPKVAFIGHLLNNDSIRRGAPSLSRLTDSELDELYRDDPQIRYNRTSIPLRFRSSFGTEVDMDFYIINRTAAQIVDIMNSPSQQEMRDALLSIARDSKSSGAEVLGFGGFTSIITGNCKNIPQVHGLAYTSGNSLTAGLGYNAILMGAERLNKDLSVCKAAVVGGAGNIGQVYASLLSEKLHNIILVGSTRKGSMIRLKRAYRRIYKDIIMYMVKNRGRDFDGIAADLFEIKEISSMLASLNPDKIPEKIADSVIEILESRYGSDPFIRLTEEETAMREADLIACTTNAPAPFIGSELVKEGTVVCDLGVPLNVKDDVIARDDVEFMQGGLAVTPDDTSIPDSILNLPPGKLYGCVTETIVMGLLGMRRHYSYGDISRDQVKEITSLANLLGFKVSSEYKIGGLI